MTYKIFEEENSMMPKPFIPDDSLKGINSKLDNNWKINWIVKKEN